MDSPTSQTESRPSQSPSAPAGDAWTYRKILDWTQAKLKERGVESPRVEAEILLAHAAGCQRILLYTRLDEPTPDAVRATMRDLVQRRMKSEPVAYLVGHREFFGLDFLVDRSVLVPRPETETLVMVGLQLLESLPESARVLEVGVGSGCVSVALAKQRPGISVTAVDVSADALVTADRNVEKHGLSGRIELREGETFAAVRGETFDLIVSNPPYIRTDEMAGLDADVRLHEPHGALEAGEDGLDVVRQLIAEGHQHLSQGGAMALEIDPAQMAATAELLAAAGWTGVKRTKDPNGNERVISAIA